MIAIPTVSRFCGCCDLKVGSIVIASLRLLLSVFVIITYLMIILQSLRKEENFDEFGGKQAVLPWQSTSLSHNVVIILSLGLAIAYIPCSYWFIRSIVSVFFRIKSRFFKDNFIFLQKNPSKMKYYVILMVVDGIVCCIAGILYKLHYFLAAAFDVYLFICSNSLYKIYMNELLPLVNEKDIATNKNENPPPPYGNNEYEKERENVQSFQKEYP